MDRAWRLILDDALGAAFNMAVDEAIMRSCASGDAPPTLRLYGWTLPSVSLGYFQRLERAQIDTKYCRDAGIEVVRRITGGRAVLHRHDLTFSIALNQDHLPEGAGDVPSSHVWLMRGIVAGLRLLGVEAEIGGNGGSNRTASADCFAHLSECDIRLDSDKIAGAAQVRRWGALLEQGSIPHTRPRVEPERVFHSVSSQGTYPLAGIPRQAVEEAIIRGFEESVGAKFRCVSLSSGELDLVLRIERMRYAAADWTHRRDTIRIDNDIAGCYTDNVPVRGGQ